MPPTFGSEATKLTIDALVDLQTPQDVNISFSGDQVAYSLGARSKKLDKNFVSSIWVAEVGKLHSARQVTSGLFNDKSPKWSPDGEYIAFLSDRAKAGESSAIYLLPIKGGGEPFPLTKAENKSKSLEKENFLFVIKTNNTNSCSCRIDRVIQMEYCMIYFSY